MGANSAPRRQNCGGWEKTPLQDWKTLSPLLPSPPAMGQGATPPVGREPVAVVWAPAGTQGEMETPITATG